MKEILKKIFSENEISQDVIPERGMQLVFVGENEDGRIVGYADENDDGDTVLHVENIISFRSGYGTELMNRLIEAAREEGYAYIEGVVFPLNDNPLWHHYQRLLRWYESLGFEYIEAEDLKAALFIIRQPGEEEIARYPGEIHRPRVRLALA